jgi:hypothetical protein
MTDESSSAPTLFDLQPDPDKKIQVGRVPSLVREGIRMLLDASRGDFLLSTALQLVGGVGIVAQLVIGQQALQALLAAARQDASVTSIVPWALAVGVCCESRHRCRRRAHPAARRLAHPPRRRLTLAGGDRAGGRGDRRRSADRGGVLGRDPV